MGLRDLFRPKWKNADPTIRLQAIEALSSPSQTTILVEIVEQDAEDSVRRAALRKIDDIQALDRLFAAESTLALREPLLQQMQVWLNRFRSTSHVTAEWIQAAQQIRVPTIQVELILACPDPGASQALIRLVQDDKQRREIVKKSTLPRLRAAALEAIQTPAVLKDLILWSQDKQEVASLVARLQDRRVLSDLARLGSKWVRQCVADRMAQLSSDAGASGIGQTPGSDRQEVLKKLCRLAEDSVRNPDWDAAVADFEQAQRQWQQSNPDRTNPQEQTWIQQFDRISSQFSARRQALLDRMKADLEKERQQAQQVVIPSRRVTPVPAVRTTREEPIRERDRAQGDLHRAYEEHTARLHALCDTLMTGLDSLPGKELSLRRKQCEDGVQNLAVLPIAAQKTLKKRFDEIRDAIRRRQLEMKELTEWKKWSSVHALETACQQAEALLQEPARPSFSKDFKELRSAWAAIQALSGADTAALKKRFRTAYKGLREIYLQSVQASQKEREENVTKKQALVVQVEALLQLTDMREISKQVRSLEQAWKQIGPMPREQAEPIMQRYRAARAQLFERLRVHRKREQAEFVQRTRQKESLCAKAESLTAESDVKIATSAVKKLQEEWKKIGSLPKKEGDLLWQRFRKACDAIFARRTGEIQQQRTDKQNNFAEKEDLCHKLEQSIQAATRPDPGPFAWLRSLWSQWKQVGPLPTQAQQEILEQRFVRLSQQFVRKYQDALSSDERATLEKEWARFENRIQIPADILQSVEN